MHPEAYVQKYLWKCVVTYHNMNYDEYNMATWDHKTRVATRPSSAHWDIVHQVHYYITKVWELHPDFKLKDTEEMFTGSKWWGWRGEFRYTSHPWSPWYIKPVEKKPLNNKWFRRRYSHEKSTKYVRRPHHEKKVLSEHEEHKKAWRAKKRGKKHKPNYSRRRSCPKHWKKIGNGRHRQWERDMIDSDNWDALSNQRKYKEVVSPWDWD